MTRTATRALPGGPPLGLHVTNLPLATVGPPKSRAPTFLKLDLGDVLAALFAVHFVVRQPMAKERDGPREPSPP